MTLPTFDPDEKHQSQVPALELLMKLGFEPLSTSQALAMRGGRRQNVLLDDVLIDQLLKLNSFTYRGREYDFDVADAHEAIRKLRPTPEVASGLQAVNQQVYDTLVLGTTISKTIDGDTKSYSFRFIDWQEQTNNVFHVTSEFAVESSGASSIKRCDIVAFVNGIPVVVIENKRPTESVGKAGSQLIAYQDPRNIPQLFHFAQLLMSMNRQEARYATVGTPRKFWHTWRDDDDSDATIGSVVNSQISDKDQESLFAGKFASARPHFEALRAAGPRALSEQDRLLFSLCRPDRLLDLIRRFTVFDAGVRKIARHQQFFAVRNTVDRVSKVGSDGRRPGGIVWHTQGSGKSLTMVMLGKAIALDARISNPRILIVTDRDDLDKQIRDTFRSCELSPVRATSGANLARLLRDGVPLVTTVINKFEAAARREVLQEDDGNLFVLVDESHRSQSGRYGGHGTFAATMRRMLPAACYLGFTGTPLLGKEKNTVAAFGGLIHRYTIDEAVADGAVVPLLYEGRLVEQQVSETVIDLWFEKISEGLSLDQKADLKRKFSRLDALGKAGQSIRAKAFDVSEHYRRYWQDSGLKAQLIAPDKASAIRYKQVLDEIGHVRSEVIISAPNEYEGIEPVDQHSQGLVNEFWSHTMERFGSEAVYNSRIIEAFKSVGGPEILIVVSKLLTGFDAPRNTVLYICKKLKQHTLLQAIARVNRLFEEDGNDKEFGFIVDYEGLLGELDKALTAYSALGGYDAEDLVGTVHDVREQIRLLPSRWNEVWDLFKSVSNKLDMEMFEQYLEPEDLRHEFYARLAAFGRCLHISLSSDKVSDVIDAPALSRYRDDWKRFADLRQSVRLRYQEVVDLHDYEPRIRRLLDDHVTASPAEVIIELVNINDPVALQAVAEDAGVSVASRADRIASATRRTITERMDEDPALYHRFSHMLQNTIDEYRAARLSERDYLQEMVEIAQQVSTKARGLSLPSAIARDEDAAAIYGAFTGRLRLSDGTDLPSDEVASIAVEILRIVQNRLIVGIWTNETAKNHLLNELDDYFWDELEAKQGIALPIDLADELQQSVIAIARARFQR